MGVSQDLGGQFVIPPVLEGSGVSPRLQWQRDAYGMTRPSFRNWLGIGEGTLRQTFTPFAA